MEREIEKQETLVAESAFTISCDSSTVGSSEERKASVSFT